MSRPRPFDVRMVEVVTVIQGEIAAAKNRSEYSIPKQSLTCRV